MTKGALRQSIAALFAEQLSGPEHVRGKKRWFFKVSWPSHLLKRVNCYQETFLKVGNKAIYLEAGHTVVHIEGCVLKIQIRLTIINLLPLPPSLSPSLSPSCSTSSSPASPPLQVEIYWLHNRGWIALRPPSLGWTRLWRQSCPSHSWNFQPEYVETRWQRQRT